MARSFAISKKLVWQAYLRVKANKGAEGIDGQTMEGFDRNLKGNLDSHELRQLYSASSDGCDD